MDIEALLEHTLNGLGYEFAGIERPGSGLLRVFIDKAQGVDVEDCARVSHHLSRLLPVEGIDYGRLEVSSPGLDRMLRKEQDFIRFAGEMARVKLRLAHEGRRNFVGVLQRAGAGKIELEVDGRRLEFALGNVEKARLVPRI